MTFEEMRKKMDNLISNNPTRTKISKGQRLLDREDLTKMIKEDFYNDNFDTKSQYLINLNIIISELEIKEEDMTEISITHLNSFMKRHGLVKPIKETK